MPFAAASDSVRLYFEEAGSGTPIIFLHEFAADHTNWEPQMRYFSRGHRCIAYSARGYTPSDVPPTPDSYGFEKFRDDVIVMLDPEPTAASVIDNARSGALRPTCSDE